jgi:prepilin-type processing-associated H-X9-DG protein
VEDQFAGTSGPCATCGKTITVPATTQATAAATGQAETAAAAAGISIVTLVAIVGGVLVVGFCMISMLIALLLPPLQATREVARRTACGNNLREIGVALQQYESEYGTLPPAYIADENGKPMHSWRVLILPQLGEQILYEQYNFAEPWDGPTNSQLGDRMPAVYACPSDPLTSSQETSYMVIEGPNTMFPGAKAIGSGDCRDGPANTLCVVESCNSQVTWTEPTDLVSQNMLFEINAGRGGEVGSYHPDGANVLFVDGAVKLLPRSIALEELRALSTRNGGETVSGY